MSTYTLSPELAARFEKLSKNYQKRCDVGIDTFVRTLIEMIADNIDGGGNDLSCAPGVIESVEVECSQFINTDNSYQVMTHINSLLSDYGICVKFDNFTTVTVGSLKDACAYITFKILIKYN